MCALCRHLSIAESVAAHLGDPVVKAAQEGLVTLFQGSPEVNTPIILHPLLHKKPHIVSDAFIFSERWSICGVLFWKDGSNHLHIKHQFHVLTVV
jgi:hypothetical protein